MKLPLERGRRQPRRSSIEEEPSVLKISMWDAFPRRLIIIQLHRRGAKALELREAFRSAGSRRSLSAIGVDDHSRCKPLPRKTDPSVRDRGFRHATLTHITGSDDSVPDGGKIGTSLLFYCSLA